MKLADKVVERLKDEGSRCVMWGDGLLVDIYEGPTQHPLNIMQRTLAALERDGRFTKTRVSGHDKNGKPRIVRCYWLTD